jgi:rod shape-determining protein MreD
MKKHFMSSVVRSKTLAGHLVSGLVGGRSRRSRYAAKGMAKHMVGPWDWILAPALISLALTLMFAAPIRIWGLVLPEPVWPMLLAFCWPLVRPSYIAPLVLAAIGLCLDVFWAAPLGFYTLLLIVIYGVFLSLRSFIIGQDAVVINSIYAIACFGFFTLGTIVITISSGEIPRLIGVGEQMLATMALYPLVNRYLDIYLHADVRFL